MVVRTPGRLSPPREDQPDRDGPPLGAHAPMPAPAAMGSLPEDSTTLSEWSGRDPRRTGRDVGLALVELAERLAAFERHRRGAHEMTSALA
jgi:hypothetical protein